MLLRNDPGACTAETVAELLKEIEALRADLASLRAALEESVRLQSHYEPPSAAGREAEREQAFQQYIDLVRDDW